MRLPRSTVQTGLVFALSAVVALLATTAGEAQESGDQASPRAQLPAGVLARLNGRDITVEEYAGYLVAALGTARLEEYLDRLLIEEEAQRLEVAVRPERVEAALKEKIERTVKSLYGGDETKFLASLKRRRTNVDDYRVRWRQRLYYDMLTEAIVTQGRTVTPEAIQAEFDRVYGDGGVRHVLRHLLVSKRLRDDGGELVRTDAEARARAQEILAELRAGGDFAQAVKQYSDDAFTRANEGRLPHYRKELYGDTFHAAVLKLTPEARQSGVLVSARGYHILELIERRVTRLETVRSELESFYRTKPSTLAERQALLERLRESATVEGLD